MRGDGILLSMNEGRRHTTVSRSHRQQTDHRLNWDRHNSATRACSCRPCRRSVPETDTSRPLTAGDRLRALYPCRPSLRRNNRPTRTSSGLHSDLGRRRRGRFGSSITLAAAACGYSSHCVSFGVTLGDFSQTENIH